MAGKGVRRASVGGTVLELPFEFWRLVFTYLPAQDLCRCCLVCSPWNELVLSLNSTHWRALYLRSSEWRHPKWPLLPESEPKSWKEEYREHYLAAKRWTLGAHQVEQSKCLYVFRSRHERKVLHVGAGFEHESLQSALSVANDLDRILIFPGVYDEQCEMSSKIPLELVGVGELGSVVLVMCLDHLAPTGRLCNLVLRSPRFTWYMLKVRTGHLQVDNCVFEDGRVEIQHPGTCHIRYSTFRRSYLNLQHISLSIVEKCEFTDSETASIVLEGFPKDETNWAYEYMLGAADLTNLLKSSRKKSIGDNENQSKLSLDADNCDCSQQKLSTSVVEEERIPVTCKDGVGGATGDVRERARHAGVAWSEGEDNASEIAQSYQYLKAEDAEARYLESFDATDSSDNEGDSLDDLDELSDSDSSDSSSLGDQSVLQLSYPSRHHFLQAKSPVTPNRKMHSINNRCRSVSLDEVLDRAAREVIEKVYGCIIRQCHIHRSHAGIMVCTQAHARIEANVCSHLQYGVRCIQNAKVLILKNSIHHCKSSGVFMRLDAQGLVAGNDIYSNSEAGIDIRRNASPLVVANRIHHGRRSGIVVLGSGQGVIRANNVYQNREAGIYILYSGNPVVRENRICQGKAAGIAVNENGRGHIVDNLISGNQWGGVDIRHGGDPLLSRNLICHGLADGIVIGDGGRGSIENNIIHSNLGCGVWVMAGVHPCIHGNQVSNNGDSGIAFVNPKAENKYQVERSEDTDNGNQGNAEVAEFETENLLPTRRTCTEATVEYNSIFITQVGGGLYLAGNDVINVLANIIHANSSTGVNIHQVAPVSIENNSITCNAGSGMIVAVSGQVDILGNGIYDNRDHGVILNGGASICDNDIISNDMCGLLVQTTSFVKICKNRIHSPSEYAISVTSGKDADIHGNTFYHGSASSSLLLAEGCGCQPRDNLTLDPRDSKSEETGDGKKKAHWCLENPPPRPHITAPPMLPTTPANRVVSMTTVTVPSIDSASSCQQGSKLCVIL